MPSSRSTPRPQRPKPPRTADHNQYERGRDAPYTPKTPETSDPSSTAVREMRKRGAHNG